MSVPFAYLIDDDPLNNAVLTETLSERKLVKKVLSSTSAENAMIYLKSIANKDEFPDIIFLDLSMPGMDGWEFMERFYLTFGTDCKTKIAILSSTRKWSDMVRSELNDEVAYFIKKPLTTGEIETFFAEFRKAS